MANYIISYNPYQNTTKIIKNGITVRKNSFLCKGVDGKRLQSWFEEDSVWPGFGKALDTDNNESECNIEFIGREIDYIDLKEFLTTLYVSDKGTKFNLASKFLSSDDDMLEKLLKLVEDIKSKDIFSKKQIEDIEKYILQIKDNPFVISVIATMSSGKSTLLNALMHNELLPTGNDATTANIVEIYDNDKETIEYKAYDKENQLVFEGGEADLKKIAEINDNSQIRTVKVYGDIPGVDARRMQLMLRDTPGPNNSVDSNHKKITESIISDAQNMSTVIYVMNATQLRVDSDKELLSNIAYEMKQGGKQANDRFLFVINKVDLRLEQVEETLEELIKDTKKYLLEEFGIKNPRIFPVTAGLACDVWKCRTGYEFHKIREWPMVKAKLEMFNADLSEVKFDLYASISPCVRRQLDEDLQKALEANDIHEVALIHSGVKGLEYSIKEYVEKYAYPIKVSDAIKDIVGTIDENRMRAKFKDILLEDERKLESVRKRIGEIKQKKEERLASKEEFQREIGSYELPESLKEEARQSVEEAFGTPIKHVLHKIPDDKAGKNKIKKSLAEELLNDLTKEINQIEKELDEKIKQMVKVSVYQKGNEILEKYREYIISIKESIKIENFDFGQVKDIKKFDFDNLKKIANQIQKDVYIDKKEIIPNPDRHWYTFWKPKTITVIRKEKTEDIEVNRKELISDIGGIRTSAQLNVNEILEAAEENIVQFKVFFAEELDKFEMVIDKILEELEESTSEESMAKSNKEEHEEQARELEIYLEEIKNITNIG